jgi:hypothetical protein
MTGAESPITRKRVPGAAALRLPIALRAEAEWSGLSLAPGGRIAEGCTDGGFQPCCPYLLAKTPCCRRPCHPIPLGLLLSADGPLTPMNEGNQKKRARAGLLIESLWSPRLRGLGGQNLPCCRMARNYTIRFAKCINREYCLHGIRTFRFRFVNCRFRTSRRASAPATPRRAPLPVIRAIA